MKRKWLVTAILAATLCLLAGGALAATDPIVCDMEISPTKLSGPGKVNVTITISNSGSTDMKDPVVLYSPKGQKVEDFGDNGAYLLKAGESKTWTGTWDVNQLTLENGSILFYTKYTLYSESGKADPKSTPIRAPIEYQAGDSDIEIRRTISPGSARSGQDVAIKYDIVNSGTVSLVNITIQENKDINAKAQSIQELKPGETAQVKFQVTMGKKDLTSSATVSYQTSDSKTVSTKEIEAQTITYGEPAMNANLTSSAKGVAINGTVTLTLDLSNKGTVDYSNLTVKDPTLGEVFTNQSLAQGGSLKLEKEVTLTETTEYQFTITAIDNTGTQVSLSTDPLTVTAMDPNKTLHLEVVTTPDRTEVFEQPGLVRFSIAVTNDSEVNAENVDIMHGGTKIYTFAEILPGETRTLTRDAALSMEGKYQFSAATTDQAENSLTFPGNEIQIAFSVPTPAPETPTPAPDPTDIPPFIAETMPSIQDSSIAPVPKMVQNILLPILIICGVVLIGSAILLIIATKRRSDQKKASEAAYDHLERTKRRDYTAPSAEPPEEKPEPKPTKSKRPTPKRSEMSPSARKRTDPPPQREARDSLDDVELPHMKYVRDAMERGTEKDRSAAKSSSLFDDEDLYGTEKDSFRRPSGQDAGAGYDDGYGYGDGYEAAGYEDSAGTYGSEASRDQAGQGYSEAYDDVYGEYDGEYDEIEDEYADGAYTPGGDLDYDDGYVEPGAYDDAEEGYDEGTDGFVADDRNGGPRRA